MTSANDQPRRAAHKSDDSQQPCSEGRSLNEKPSNWPAAIAAVGCATANYEDA